MSRAFSGATTEKVCRYKKSRSYISIKKKLREFDYKIKAFSLRWFFYINSRNLFSWLCIDLLERFSYDLEMKTREQNRDNKGTEIERFDWFIERIQTRVAFGWLSERSDEKTSCPKNFLEINRYFALTSYCNTIGQSNNAFSILGFSLAGKQRVHVLIFSSIGW